MKGTRATVDDVLLAVLIFSIITFIITLQLGSLPLLLLSVFGISFSLFLEGWKAWHRRNMLLFSQQLLRGISLLAIVLFISYYQMF
ncbi:hypothetical protein [Gracilibacillus sp. YIM 98692]|uniref:hypothetical protein n=1 Tax=Gracilibacillus sp. YIM 98692 TaxID=2663532 RepID=UPI0013D2D119|nr:hypothetical protein [Gracilibacillus sp. YIM 98692]